MGQRVLVVDDEKLIVKGIRFSLEQDNMEVDCAYDGEEALEKLRANEYDMVLLDIMLPKLTGLEVCQQLREFSNVPVIMLTAKGDDMDKIMGLEYGADDYITKPFALEELEARINVQLRKHHTDKDDGIIVQNLILYPDRRTFQIDDTKVSLTKHEYRIMELLMQYPKRAFSKKDIYEYAWDDIYAADDKTVSVHISNIRNKCKGRHIIETVWGIGFKLKLERE